MNIYARRITTKFIQSRVYPILTLLILFLIWILAACLILLHARLKEEFLLKGRLFEDHTGYGTTITFNGVSNEDISFIKKDDKVRLCSVFSGNNGDQPFIDAKVIKITKQARELIIMLDVRNRVLEHKNYWLNMEKGSINEFILVVRKKPLLSVIFEKSRFADK